MPSKPDGRANVGSVRPFRSVVNSQSIAVFAVRYGMFLALLLWLVVLSIVNENFLTSLNFLNVARQAAPILIIAVGMTFVMSTAGIDLSVGSTVALTSCLAASWLAAGLPTALVVPLVLGVGVLVGLTNGYFICLGLPPFVVTLAGLTAVRGAAFVYTNGYAIPVQAESFVAIGRGSVGGIHVPIIIAAAVAAVGWFVLRKTRFGLYALAIGGREEAARLMGIKIDRIKMTVYAATGGLAALGGVIVTARLANGSPNAGISMEQEVIAATVLGGTNLFGGHATIAGTVVGALFINFVRNGLNLMGINPFWVQVVTGVILLLAVLLNTVVNRRVEEWAGRAGKEEAEP